MLFVQARRRVAGALLSGALLVSGCAVEGAPAAATAPRQASGAPIGSESGIQAASEAATSTPTPAAGEPATRAGSSEPGASEDHSPQDPSASEPAQPSGPETFNPYTSDVPVTASLSPTCTIPGGEFTVTIETRPEIVVTYHAIYAGEEGGAAEPFGKGHGGNNAGYSDEQGRYTDTWVVSPDAPIGEGRVEVFAGDEGKVGYVPVTFEIADPLAGGCR